MDLNKRPKALHASLSHLIDKDDTKDVHLLQRLSFQLAITEHCQQKLYDEGLMVEDDKGSLKTNPYINICYNANGLVLRFAKMIGIKKEEISVELDLD